MGTLLNTDETSLLLQRTSGNASVCGITYTDKQLFTFTDAAGACEPTGCSESQGASVADFSTNYCDLRNLYCGKADGCSPVDQDFAVEETSVRTSIGASKDKSACIVKKASAMALNAASVLRNQAFLALPKQQKV